MKTTMRRVVLLTRKIDKMTTFYRDVMGLKLVAKPPAKGVRSRARRCRR